MPMSAKNTPKILFRCDSSSSMGYGHLQRSLALAHQLSPFFTIHFATLPLIGSGDHLITKAAFPLIHLKDGSVETLIELSRAEEIWMIVIDHYDITESIEQQIRSIGIKIAVFDDLYLPHSCDILLNGAPYADAIRYRSILNDPLLLLQTPYFPLRQEFLDITKRPRSPLSLKHAIINFGATDPYRITLSILPILVYDFESITVLSTSANPSLDEFETLCSTFQNVTLIVDSSMIAAELDRADILIASPSTICIEALSLHLPCILYQSADNQLELTHYFRTFFGTETVLESITENEWKRVYTGFKDTHAKILEKCSSHRFSNTNLLEAFCSVWETKV